MAASWASPRKPYSARLSWLRKQICRPVSKYSGRLLLPAQAQVQAATTQGDPSQQGFGIRMLPAEQTVHVAEQLIGPAGRSALLEQLRVIEFQQPFEYQ